MNLAARLRLRPAFDVAIPGLYAWVVTVGWPLHRNAASTWAYGFGAIAFVALAVSSWMVLLPYRLWSAVAVGAFITASAIVWFLVDPESLSLGLLGSVGYAAFAVGWVRASGTREVDKDALAYALDLPPRRNMSLRAMVALYGGLVGAIVPLALAFRIEDRQRALLGHAVALLGALHLLSIASKLSIAVGQKAEVSSFSWSVLGRTVLLIVLVGVGGWVTFFYR